jgi:hypothetical protein
MKNIKMKKILFEICVFSYPLLFLGARCLLRVIIRNDDPQSLMDEIIEAMICGALSSYALCSLYRKVNKNNRHIEHDMKQNINRQV